MRRWVVTWKAAGPELAAIRREDVRTMDNVLAVQQLGDCFNDATRSHPPRESSGMDVSLAALPFEESAVERASPYTFAPGSTMVTCSAEDLMVMKLFASRAIDLSVRLLIQISSCQTRTPWPGRNGVASTVDHGAHRVP
jgi:hypothetical protein